MQRSRRFCSTCSIMPPRCSGASVSSARAEGVREVALVDHAALVQGLHHHDVGRSEARHGLEQRFEFPHQAAWVWSVRQSVASSTSTLTGLAR